MSHADDMQQAQMLAKQGKLREAATCYQSILRERVDVEALHNLGVVLGQLGHSDAATQALEKVVELRPDFAEAWRNLGVMHSRANRIDAAVKSYRLSLGLKPQDPSTHSSLLLMLPYQDGYDPRAVADAHREFGKRFADPLTANAPPLDNDFDPNRRLRVGYVSPDFREHSVSFFFELVLAHHRPDKVETFCYSNVAHADDTTARLKSLAHVWRDALPLSDEQLAEQIRTDRIDILIDLAGHTGNNRLLTFARPAPVQASFLGYAATTGVSAIGYRITDAHADPPGMTETFWTEKLIRLPRTAWCYRPPANCPEPAAKFQDQITFGCFGRVAKHSSRVKAMWQEIIQQVSGARLLLKGSPQLPGCATVAEHLANYQQIDIALDTFPYQGTTTTCEALWMGVPVITLAGESHISRVGVSLLTNVGLAELIASDDASYIRLAVELASDRDRLSSLRHNLRERMTASPLMDEQGFVADLEAAYRTIWTDACDRADQSRRGR